METSIEPKNLEGNKQNKPNNIRKMLFLFNAINDGWTITKINEDTYEFKKNKEKIKKGFKLSEFLRKQMDRKKTEKQSSK